MSTLFRAIIYTLFVFVFIFLITFVAGLFVSGSNMLMMKLYADSSTFMRIIYSICLLLTSSIVWKILAFCTDLFLIKMATVSGAIRFNFIINLVLASASFLIFLLIWKDPYYQSVPFKVLYTFFYFGVCCTFVEVPYSMLKIYSAALNRQKEIRGDR